MRITFVLPGIGFSGGIRTVYECSNRLIDKGHEVNIVYPLLIEKFRVRRGLRTWLESFLIMVRRLRLGREVRWFKLKAKIIRIPFFSPRFAKRLPPSDVIIATAAETARFVADLKGSFGQKLYFVQHYETWGIWNDPQCWELLGDRPSQAMPQVEPPDLQLKSYKQRLDRTYRLPLKIFTTSSWLRELIENNFGQKVIGRVEIGNDAAFFSCQQSVEKRGDLILMPFRGEIWRGDQDGIAALVQVRQVKPTIKVALFGSGLHRHQAPDWAEYHADLSDEALRDLYCRADLFVLPSWVEGWCSPPMEAMSCGTACVSTQMGALADYSVPGQTVILVPPREPDKLAKACLELLDDRQKRERIARAGHDCIQQFTWERTANQMEKIFYLLVSSHETKED
jgi:glycosyltransferase involved in cell wall biosynthesis